MSYDYIIKDASVYTDITTKPEAGCLCWGLYLEGCRWDYENHALAESTPKKLFVDLPLMHFIPIAERVKPETGIYNCPVYKVLSRTGTLSTTGHSTNFVMWLELASDKNPDFWIKAGVAAFLSLRY